MQSYTVHLHCHSTPVIHVCVVSVLTVHWGIGWMNLLWWIVIKASYPEISQECICDISHWMDSNKLMLNIGKTEAMIVSTASRVTQVENNPIQILDSYIIFSKFCKISWCLSWSHFIYVWTHKWHLSFFIFILETDWVH